MIIDPMAIETVRVHLRQRDAAERVARAAQRERAWAAARRGAALLRNTFGARRVRLFGSLVDDDGDYFGIRSDIDLAAWGLPDDAYFSAVARLQNLSPEFSVDLVAMERCPPELRPIIEARVVDL